MLRLRSTNPLNQEEQDKRLQRYRAYGLTMFVINVIGAVFFFVCFGPLFGVGAILGILPLVNLFVAALLLFKELLHMYSAGQSNT